MPETKADHSTGCEQQLAEAADYIAGERHPAELRACLALIADAVARQEAEFQHSPKRAEFRERLTAVAKAASALAELLNDDTTQECLRLLPSYATRDPEEFKALAQDAESMLCQIRAGAGPKVVADSLGSPRPRLLVAIGVVQLWRHFRGCRPKRDTAEAQLACNLIWQAAGNSALGSDDSWERHLRIVREAKWAADPSGDAALVSGRLAVGGCMTEAGIGRNSPKSRK